jgi:hypothetical protein
MKVGKLYQIKKKYWLLYPSGELATSCAAVTSEHYVESHVIYWSERLKCNVSYVCPGTLFLLLEKKDFEYGCGCKILAADGQIGWLFYIHYAASDIEIQKA